MFKNEMIIEIVKNGPALYENLCEHEWLIKGVKSGGCTSKTNRFI